MNLNNFPHEGETPTEYNAAGQAELENQLVLHVPHKSKSLKIFAAVVLAMILMVSSFLCAFLGVGLLFGVFEDNPRYPWVERPPLFDNPPYVYNRTTWVNPGHINTTDAFVNAANQTAPSVVSISVSRGGGIIGGGQGAGSGVIWAESVNQETGERTGTYIITNEHVTRGGNEVDVVLVNGDRFPALVIGYDVESDIAVVWINVVGLHMATLGSSDDLVIGTSVLAIGNALGQLSGTVTSGIISATSRRLEVAGHNMTLLQMDAAVNPGNSGGGLFTLNGELVGIVNAKSMGPDVEGVGFAIPIDIALEVASDLVYQGFVRRARIGINILNLSPNGSLLGVGDDLMPHLHRDGELIHGVFIMGADEVIYAANSPEFRFGDLIRYINGAEISNGDDISEQLERASVGGTMTIVVERYIDGEVSEHTIRVILGERLPANFQPRG